MNFPSHLHFFSLWLLSNCTLRKGNLATKKLVLGPEWWGDLLEKTLEMSLGKTSFLPRFIHFPSSLTPLSSPPIYLFSCPFTMFHSWFHCSISLPMETFPSSPLCRRDYFRNCRPSCFASFGETFLRSDFSGKSSSIFNVDLFSCPSYCLSSLLFSARSELVQKIQS